MKRLAFAIISMLSRIPCSLLCRTIEERTSSRLGCEVTLSLTTSRSNASLVTKCCNTDFCKIDRGSNHYSREKDGAMLFSPLRTVMTFRSLASIKGHERWSGSVAQRKGSPKEVSPNISKAIQLYHFSKSTIPLLLNTSWFSPCISCCTCF